MRPFRLSVPMLLLATPLLAQEPEASGGTLMSLQTNLMFWTLLIFLVLFYLLTKFAFKPITAAVEAREKALEDALASAKRDRDEAAALLAEHKAQLDGARGEVQKLIADGRATAEKMRHDLMEKARAEQQDTVERGVQEIQREKERAVAELRREAIEMAIAGASRVIEENLDSEKNRKLVERFLSTLTPAKATH
ncbi:MAG: ATP synthase F0 subunit B [Gemmatimonadetes bacterium 21-71-4]|nr:MAG: ATP synthase F0 subunit B [Gemmatimonadetes bacterium 21-71-4]